MNLYEDNNEGMKMMMNFLWRWTYEDDDDLICSITKDKRNSPQHNT
jgi:hypothetical protein